ncbi:pectate lyase, partial [uncultured Gimesia sp.]|uniref:pectate lyase n=1 Tax=uncultured Gimesia sp. TaxID=1678688 RepID=UPI002620D7D2
MQKRKNCFQILFCFALTLIVGFTENSLLAAESVSKTKVIRAMRNASDYYRDQLAVRGGYVYYYSLDKQHRWGEGKTGPDQIWVQPPGTPTVGMAYLKAYQATGDQFYLDAATDAALALIYGQLKSGGWTNSVEFNPKSKLTAAYRNGKGKGKNNSTLDDGITQSAIQLLIHVDQAHQFQNQKIHNAAIVALNALLKAQYPVGAFPQVWTGPVEKYPGKAASFPDYDWRTEGRIKNYWECYTLNDGLAGHVSTVLIEAYQIYQEERYRQAVLKLGDFLIAAQLPAPQPAWAQQYNYEMQPIWARKFEPPAVTCGESQDVIQTLMKIYRFSGDRKYLKPIPTALAYLKKSHLPDGQLARYYELKTNRPLYMNRNGKKYSLTYDDSNLPRHYGWKIRSQWSALQRDYQALTSGKQQNPSHTAKRDLGSQVQTILNELDDQARWISTSSGERLVGQPKFPVNSR